MIKAHHLAHLEFILGYDLVHFRLELLYVSLLLGTTDLHIGMILFTLSISFRGFAFGLPKRSHTNKDTVPYL